MTFFGAFFANPLFDPLFKGSKWARKISNIAYATLQLQTFPTLGRSTFYLIPSRHLFNRKMTFKASGRRRRGRGRRGRRIALAPCK